jgi:tripartite motif-containing protein 9/67
VHVKTFHGKRTNFEFTVLITDKLDRLRELLVEREPDEMCSYHVLKFVYAMGSLKNLPLDQSFEQLEIPNGAQLALLGQKSFTWDLNYKGSNIQLLNNSLTANKKYEIDYETVLGTIGFSSGNGGHSRHYWEIKLDTFVDLEDIYVGIARRNVDLHMRAWDTGSFWGWICAG